jgi:HlyD family secretion protein
MQKKNKIIIIVASAIVLIGIIVLLYFIFGTNSSAGLTSIEAKNGNIIEKINLDGQVKASEGVDLSFEGSGRVVANYVKVGDKIYAGQPLLAIDSSILQSQLKQAEAQLDVLNINTVKSKTDSGLQTAYASSLAAAQKSVSTAKNILLTVSDLQFSNFTGQTQQNNALQSTKEAAVMSLLGQAGAGSWTSQSIAQLNGGAYGAVQAAVDNPTQSNIDLALANTQIALQDINSMINAIPIDSSLTAAQRATINTVQASINLEIMTTSANIATIANLKVNNSATISTTNAQIEAAQASIDAIKTQISKTVITALFNGQVDKDDTIVGQLVSPNVPVVTISNSNLEIDTYIPEIDLADAKIGGDANVTLDAYGDGINFPATIISINSAPSIINGVSAYGAKLKFKNYDDRVKTGMTANITVISTTHQNVLEVPKSAVVQNNNNYFVVVDKGNSIKETRQVTIGIHDDQNIEIISGLKLGEKVFSY